MQKQSNHVFVNIINLIDLKEEELDSFTIATDQVVKNIIIKHPEAKKFLENSCIEMLGPNKESEFLLYTWIHSHQIYAFIKKL
jgi:hypothetical protein